MVAEASTAGKILEIKHISERIMITVTIKEKKTTTDTIYKAPELGEEWEEFFCQPP